MSGCFPPPHPTPISLGDFNVDGFGGGCSGSWCLPTSSKALVVWVVCFQQPPFFHGSVDGLEI